MHEISGDRVDLKIFVNIYDYLQEKLGVGVRAEFVSVWPIMRTSAGHLSTFAECGETSALCRKAQCVPGSNFSGF